MVLNRTIQNLYMQLGIGMNDSPDNWVMCDIENIQSNVLKYKKTIDWI